MNLFTAWLATIVASFVADFNLALKMFKDMADLGFKINYGRFSELSKKINPDGMKTNLITKLIPIYNIYAEFKKSLSYSKNKELPTDKLCLLGAIEEMSDYEKKLYKKKPTGFTALLLPFVADVKKKECLKIEGKDYVVYFAVDSKTKELSIVKKEGSATKLSDEELKEVITESLAKSQEAKRKAEEKAKKAAQAERKEFKRTIANDISNGLEPDVEPTDDPDLDRHRRTLLGHELDLMFNPEQPTEQPEEPIVPRKARK